jgi:tRNA U34 5-methylaminomethyl-2-thiouridine-forming methyltransferase MnmC
MRTSKFTPEQMVHILTLNEFTDHFAEMMEPMSRGEVEGVAMAVVTADGVMWSTLVRDTMTALVLRDTTRNLWMECEQKFHDDMEAACR